MVSNKEIFRSIPKVDEFLNDSSLRKKAPLSLLTKTIQETLDHFRKEIKEGTLKISLEEVYPHLVRKILQLLSNLQNPYLRRVINGTGIILHTGLGRAPLAEGPRKALWENGGYMMLEIDQESGKRGVREKTISRLLCQLTGAEAATVVNNNAAATLIALAALAKDKEVIVSRGQLVEIGGSFRIPDVMAQGGAILREVGCTNKTHQKDYIKAITENTALLLEVHTSNYRIVGFSEMVDTETLVEIGRAHHLPVMYDMGSGNLVDLKPFGILDEPTVQEKIQAGVDIATFSGDKLLGGPQAGIVVGKKEYVSCIRSHPLFRALRPGKFDLIALERTLLIYLNGNPLEEIPGLKMISTPARDLFQRAEKFLGELKTSLFSSTLEFEIVEEPAQIGSGALPTLAIPSYALALKSKEKSAQKLSEELRRAETPVFSRIRDDLVLLNFRTIFEEEESELIRILREMG